MRDGQCFDVVGKERCFLCLGGFNRAQEQLFVQGSLKVDDRVEDGLHPTAISKAEREQSVVRHTNAGPSLKRWRELPQCVYHWR